jgi:hypothetical protein
VRAEDTGHYFTEVTRHGPVRLIGRTVRGQPGSGGAGHRHWGAAGKTEAFASSGRAAVEQPTPPAGPALDQGAGSRRKRLPFTCSAPAVGFWNSAAEG